MNEEKHLLTTFSFRVVKRKRILEKGQEIRVYTHFRERSRN